MNRRANEKQTEKEQRTNGEGTKGFIIEFIALYFISFIRYKHYMIQTNTKRDINVKIVIYSSDQRHETIVLCLDTTISCLDTTVSCHDTKTYQPKTIIQI